MERRIAWVASLVLVAGVLIGAWLPPPGESRAAPPPRARPNPNTSAAGRPAGDTTAIELVARLARWFPEADGGLSVVVQAFGEAAGPPSIPGPMIRVPAGRTLRVTVTNRLDSATLVVHGLVTRPAEASDTLRVPPGASRTVTFAAGAPGTYFYWATTTDRPDDDREGSDSQLSGAFIVDEPGAPAAPDRVFVIGNFSEPVDPAAPSGRWREALAINGKVWPHTERLTLPQGDTVRWRVINASSRPHPMHLHGFFFEVLGHGTALHDTAVAAASRQLVVTQVMPRWTTMGMAFVPHTIGNWVFHCHILFHIESQGLAGVPAVHGAHAGMDDMRGLVLGMRVTPRRGAGPPPAAPVAHRLRLLVQERPRVYGDSAGYGFVLAGGGPVAPDSIVIPGPPLVLTRGERTAITVVNQLREPTAVHWHGIELESYFDGVAGLSGSDRRIARSIQPGDSFVVQITPLRAGTFIYHSHFNDIGQISRGLYGPLIVLEPGERYDPATDLVWMHSQDPRLDEGDILFNGRAAGHAPLMFTAGVRYRIRLIGIPAGPSRIISLVRGAAPAQWRWLAKDGADVPAALAQPRPARQQVFIGETFDFAFVPEAGPLEIVVAEPRSNRSIRIPAVVR